MNQSLRKIGPFTARTWTITIVASLGILVLLAICSYQFNWKWTGFNGNTLWDWLQLLLLPISITAATVWFSTRQQWRAQWTIIFIVIIVAFIVLAIGGYRFGWKWTGFGGNTLWDWLKLLILPIVLPTATIWFTTQPDHPGEASASSVQQEQPTTEEQQAQGTEETVHLPPVRRVKKELA
ncbi:MAG: hypothetical protein NVS4B7_16930 [Ktedonobacteraceae bacterium]